MLGGHYITVLSAGGETFLRMFHTLPALRLKVEIKYVKFLSLSYL
jgi:hypothetical protein